MMKKEVLTQEYDRKSFQRFVTDFLPEDFAPADTEVALPNNPNYTTSIRRLGKSKSLELEVFEFRHSSMKDARVGICKDAFSTMLHQSNYNRALIAFVPAEGEQWRLSLLEMEAEINDKTNRIKRSYSNPRRYSFILGVGAKVKTPTQFIVEGGRVTEKADKNGKPMTAWEDLKSRFSVEVLTHDFYTQLYRWFMWAIDERSGVYFPNDVYTSDDDFDRIPERIIRLITRLLFVWFIKQKELIPNEIFNTKDLETILKDFDPESKTESTYYNAILQNLFFATLNQEVDKRVFLNDYKDTSSKWSVKDIYRDDTKESYFKPEYGHERILYLFHKVPYMNSGLFECLDTFKLNDEGRLVADMYYDGFSSSGVRDKKTNRFTRRAFIPNMLFFAAEHEESVTTNRAEKERTELRVQGLINILEEYNFTIEENTPSDVHVSLDPELLGRVFEELLAAYDPESGTTLRKATGSFYTPREIVDYMVEESLIAHLTRLFPGKEEGIRRLVKHNEMSEEEVGELPKEEIIEALYDIKILDPACGSGAFPMGCLLKICNVIQTLNPKEYDSYETKLKIIQNCVYGVDIQPVAMLITRLRFFITLLCEQTPDLNNPKGNFGINPLPNLDTRFVAANTLLPPEIKEYEDDRWNDERLVTLRNELFRIRAKMFSSRTKSSNKKYREEDIEKRNEIKRYICSKYSEPDRNIIDALNKEIERLTKDLETPENVQWQEEIATQGSLFDDVPQSLFNQGINKMKRGWLKKKISDCKKKIDEENLRALGDGFDKAITQVTEWDPFDQNMTSPFFDAEWMFDVCGGFDIVIGNPPYIRLENDGGELARIYEHCDYSTFVRKGDIYCLFYERGWQMLEDMGHLCFITSNKWMRAGYGEKTREFFAKQTNPVLLIDFAGVKIFENATVDTNILLFSKSDNQHKTLCAVTSKQNRDSIRNLSVFVQHNGSVCDFSTSDSWVILSPIEQSIKRKIEAVGTPLKDWDIQINYGIKTGFNDAFIISTEKREEILANCQTEDERKRTDELIRPILRGRDIKRYSYVDNGLYLINTHNGVKGKFPRIDINDYPAVKAHLDQYWDKISTRTDKGDTPYNLRNCAYLEDFYKPKITWGNLNLEGSYSYVPEGMFINAPSPFIATDNLAILHILNSKIADYFIRSLGVTRNGGYFEYKPMFVDKLPIPKIGLEELNKITEQPSAQEEQEITAIIYKIYGFTSQEIDYIEKKDFQC